MARQVLENGVILPAEYSDDWYDDMTSNLTKLDDVIGSDSEKLSSTDVGAAALSNNYNDLDNLPTIPTVNDATLTIKRNGEDVQTFTANASSNVTCNITVPTKTSDLTNDSDFVDTSNSAVASGITSAKVSDYDTHIADTDIHVTTADKTSWNTVTSKANDSDVVHKSGDESVIGSKRFGVVQNFTGYPTIRLYSTIDDINVVPSYTQQLDIRFTDKNNAIISYFIFQHRSDANEPFRTCWRQNKLDGTSGYYSVNFNNLGEFYPENVNTINLGTPTCRWKGVYATNYYYGSNNVEFSTKFVTTDTAQTISGNKTFSSINGVEPSSLSLPSGNLNDIIDISSYLSVLDGSSANTYVAPANGWISITMSNSSGIQAYIIGLWGHQIIRPTAGGIRFLMPILKNNTANILIFGGTIDNARFIPCQGNV